MPTWREIFEGYVDCEYDELLNLANGFVNRIYEHYKKVSKYKETARDLCEIVFLTFIAADGKLSKFEYKLYSDIFGSPSRHELLNRAKTINDDDVNMIFNDCKNDQDLADACTCFGLCICAIDGNISTSEQDLIIKYSNIE